VCGKPGFGQSTYGLLAIVNTRELPHPLAPNEVGFEELGVCLVADHARTGLPIGVTPTNAPDPSALALNGLDAHRASISGRSRPVVLREVVVVRREGPAPGRSIAGLGVTTDAAAHAHKASAGIRN